jgi:hypothetical protein
VNVEFNLLNYPITSTVVNYYFDVNIHSIVRRRYIGAPIEA